MIPTSSSDVDTLIEEAERQSEELATHFASVSPDDGLWRPSAQKWSMTGHVAHLVILNQRYAQTLEALLLGEGATDLPRSDGPYRHPAIAKWFVRSMEPPPKRRFRTQRVMVPDPATPAADAVEGFTATQRRLVELLGAARGVDLGRVRFGSPFLPLLRLSLGTAFEVVLAHNRRHIWLVHEVNRALPRG